MRRLGWRTYLTIVATLILLLIAFMPLRFALGDSVTARRIDGSIWSGSIRDARLGKLPIGDVNAGIKPFSLLTGKAEMVLSRGDAPHAPGLRGSVSRSLTGGSGIHDFTATLPVSLLFAPLPVQELQLEKFSAVFNGNRCAEASGSARLTVGAGIAGLELATGLLGTPRCDKGDLLIPLTGQSGMEHVDIRAKADGSYTVTILIEDNRPELVVALGLFGFRPVSGGMGLIRRGRF